jgi:hypothetical protein
MGERADTYDAARYKRPSVTVDVVINRWRYVR